MINDEEFIINACVVDSVSMSIDVILGTDILTEAPRERNCKVHLKKCNCKEYF